MRIEALLFVSTVAIVGTLTVIEFKPAAEEKIKEVPELTFGHTVYTEVDTNHSLGISISESGFYHRNSLKLESFRYRSETLDALHAKQAIYKEGKIRFEGDVHLVQANGDSYRSQIAIYDQKSGVLTIPVPFRSERFDTAFYGESMVYYGKNEQIEASNIQAKSYLNEGSPKEKK